MKDNNLLRGAPEFINKNNESVQDENDFYCWTKVEKQQSIDSFLEQVCGFHDSIITEINYISGGYVNADKSMYPTADLRRVKINIQSQICDESEMVFDGVEALNLRTVDENYTADIFSATLRLEDGKILFCDDNLGDKQPCDKNDTWVKARSLKWKFIK